MLKHFHWKTYHVPYFSCLIEFKFDSDCIEIVTNARSLVSDNRCMDDNPTSWYLEAQLVEHFMLAVVLELDIPHVHCQHVSVGHFVDVVDLIRISQVSKVLHVTAL